MIVKENENDITLHTHMTQQRLLRPAVDHSSLKESELQDRVADIRRTISAQGTLWPGENIPKLFMSVERILLLFCLHQKI